MPTFLYDGLPVSGLALNLSTWTFDAQDQDVLGTDTQNTFNVLGVTSYVDGNTFDMAGGDDFFLGSNLSEVVYGGTGSDTLHGGGGADTLIGGAGVDSLNGGNGSDVFHTGFVDGSIDLFYGGHGTNTVIYGGMALDGLILTAATGIHNFDTQDHEVKGTSASNTFDVSGLSNYVDSSIFELKVGDDTFIGSGQGEIVYGGKGSDTLSGNGGMDTLYGGKGVDSLSGGIDDDVLGTGFADGSTDLFDGGQGIDTVLYGGQRLDGLILDSMTEVERLDADGQTVEGTNAANVFDVSGLSSYTNGNTFNLRSGDDSFTGSEQAEVIYGGKGSDTINGNGGVDNLFGGAGVDHLFGGGGDDVFYTGLIDGSADLFDGGGGHDQVIYGGENLEGLMLGDATSIEQLHINDASAKGTKLANVFDVSGLLSYSGANQFDLRGGDDLFLGSGQGEVVYGGKGSDTLTGNGGDDTLYGGGGFDLFFGGKGADHFYTGNIDGNVDVFDGGKGIDTVHYDGLFALEGLLLGTGTKIESFDADGASVVGTSAANVFDLSSISTYSQGNLFEMKGGDDSFTGSITHDEAYGGNGADTLSGREGEDTLFGEDGSDHLDGGASDDLLNGGKGSDQIFGGKGSDTLVGKGGDDILEGGKGNDLLTGGLHADTFVFANSWGSDVITDFDGDDAEDIDLSAVTEITDFADLLANHLQSGISGFAEIFVGSNLLVLDGVAFAEVGVGLAYSDNDFIF
ncbi:calcium-binding protein [Planktotalea sp.]|uniref:calcium-binding protein n=1 Tax=Planktotalea sp. TaxID=2029877 RepID=UPI003D6C365F